MMYLKSLKNIIVLCLIIVFLSPLNALAAKKKKAIAMFPMQFTDIDEGVAAQAQAAFEFALELRYNVVGTDLVNQALKESELTLDTCTTPECLVQITDKLKTPYIARSSISKIEGIYMINLEIKDPAQNVIIESLMGDCDQCNEEQILAKIRELIEGSLKYSTKERPKEESGNIPNTTKSWWLTYSSSGINKGQSFGFGYKKRSFGYIFGYNKNSHSEIKNERLNHSNYEKTTDKAYLNLVGLDVIYFGKRNWWYYGLGVYYGEKATVVKSLYDDQKYAQDFNYAMELNYLLGLQYQTRYGLFGIEYSRVRGTGLTYGWAW